jgi:hypothetical protein
MAILERTVLEDYPGAITEVRVPFGCIAWPTIQLLAEQLMNVESEPSVIIGGKIFTQKAAADIVLDCVI